MSATPRGVDSAQVIEVIRTEAIKGEGIEEDPVRNVIQFWGCDGELLAENDTWNPLPLPSTESLLASIYHLLGDVEVEVRSTKLKAGDDPRGAVGDTGVFARAEGSQGRRLHLRDALEDLLEQLVVKGAGS